MPGNKLPGYDHLVPAGQRRLSAQYTVSGGYRALDILHVATALQVEADQLLTFDASQSALARAAGLGVAP